MTDPRGEPTIRGWPRRKAARKGAATRVSSLRELPKVYFERLLESSPDIVIAVDRSGTIIFYNDGARNTLGRTNESVLGHDVETIYGSRAEAARVMDAMRSEDHGGAGHVTNFETEFVDAAGNKVPVAISGSIIYDDRGRELGSIGFAKDIRALRRHDRQVTMGELAISLAHEVNNPLEIAVNQAALLERYLKEHASSEDYPKVHDRVEAINRALRRIQSIVERVGEIADQGAYETREYLPGRKMTDLGMQTLDQGSGAPANHADIEGRRILVIDDDEDARASLADLLSSEGCSVITCPSGQEALRYLRRSDVDLVLSDVVMPDMDGYDLFMEIRNRHRDLPVVLMTAYYFDKDHVIKRSKAQGLGDVIFKKPIDPSRLVELVASRVGC